MTARAWFRRGAMLIVKVAIAIVILALMAVDVFFIALELPQGQRFAIGKVNALLAEQFRGTLRIDSIEDIDLAGVRGAQVSLLDPDGNSIAVMRGVGGRVDLAVLLTSLLRSQGPLRIHVDRAEIRDGMLSLQTDASGALTIQRSFEPKHPEPAPAEPGRELDFVLDSLRITHAWVHGAIESVPVDADLTDLSSNLHYDARGFALDSFEARISARGLPRGTHPEGSLAGMLIVPQDGELGGSVHFDGSVNRIPASIEARMSGERIALSLHVPKTDPKLLRELVPELSIQVPVQLIAFAEGTPEHLDLTVDGEAGQTRISGTGALRLTPEVEISAKVKVKKLDLQALDPKLPALHTDADANLTFELDSKGRPEGRLRLATRGLELDGKRYPDAFVDADLHDDRLKGTLNLPAAGPDNRLRFQIDGLFDQRVIHLDADALVKLEDLRGVAQLPSDLRGRGLVQATATIDRTTSLVNATVRAELAGVFVAETGVGKATILGTAIGDLREPRLNVKAQLNHVTRPDLQLERLTVGASGSLEQIHLQVAGNETKGGRSIAARADVNLTNRTARNLDAVVKNGGVELHAKAKSLALRDRGVVVDGLEIEGAGDLELSIQTRPGSIAIKGKGKNIDLEKIARLLRIEQRAIKGRSTFDVDLRIAGSRIDGRANVRVDDAMFDGVGPLDATLDAVADDGTIDGTAALDFEPAGNLRMRAVELELGNDGASLDGLKQASGRIELVTKVDLARLPENFSELLPFDQAKGEVRLAVDALRTEPRAPANLRVYLDTRQLELLSSSSPAPIKDRKEAIRRKPRRLAGMDLNAELRVIGVTRKSSLLARIQDKKGALVDVQAETQLTVEDALAGGLMARLWHQPLQARVVVPRRKLSELPAMVRPTALAGEISLDAEAEGTLADPNLALDFRIDQLRSKDPNRRFSMDFRTQARYMARHAEVALDASNRGKPLGHVRVWADGGLPDIARGKGFVASGQAMFRGLPLALVPTLRERQVKGKLYGDVALTDLGKNAKLRAELTTRELKFGALTVHGARIQMRAENGHLSANAAVDHTGGFARAKLDAGIKWGDRLVFEVDDGRPMDAELEAKNFRAAVLLPFVQDVFSELDGDLNANLRLYSTGGQTQVLGEASLEKGTVQIPSIGQEFHDVHAGVKAEPGGILKIENASARALTGKVRAAASARLKGLSLYAADARIRIDHREQLPITVEGVTLGEAWGDADLSLRTAPERNTTRLSIKVPRFHLELTEVERSQLQSLDDPERVRIGVQLDKGKFRSLPLQPLEEPGDGASTLLLDIELGNDVWVRQGSTVRVKLAGRLQLEVNEQTSANGKINLSRGLIDVQGKRFEIERGVVTFQNDDPSNPLVVVTASWDSPEGYRVYADYRGRAKSGKLALRAEPPLSQDEILSLLLFGTPDGSFGADTGKGNQAALAVGVAGGAATQGLNRAIGDLTTLDVSTRIDTSYGDPRPEVVVQLTRRLSAELSYAVGEPAPGQSPDRTFLTLDLRLGSRWSVATTFGDRGASMLDLLWRYRY